MVGKMESRRNSILFLVVALISLHLSIGFFAGVSARASAEQEPQHWEASRQLAFLLKSILSTSPKIKEIPPCVNGKVPPQRLSEADQIALESSGELLPPANISRKIEKDLQLIRSQHPALKYCRHVPLWTPGQLVVPEWEVEEHLHKINESSSLYGPYHLEETPDKSLIITFDQPYNSDKLAQILRDDPKVELMSTPSLLTSSESSIKISLVTKPGVDTVFYRFQRGGERCSRLECFQARNWLFQVDGNGRVTEDFKFWLSPPKVSEAEQIALESSSQLLPPPELSKRIAKDLLAIRSKYPPIAQFSSNYPAKWTPGELILGVEGGKYMEQLHSSKYGPFQITPFPDYGGPSPVTFILTFEKPYHPEVLGKLLEKEVGLPGKLTRPNGLEGWHSAVTLTSGDSLGNNSYAFKKSGWEGKGCPAVLCSWSTFSVDLEGNVKFLGEKEGSDKLDI